MGPTLSARRRTSVAILIGAEKFCRQNPDAIGVPMSATGHATIYEWTCVGREARIVRQSTQVDARGFIAGQLEAARIEP